MFTSTSTFSIEGVVCLLSSQGCRIQLAVCVTSGKAVASISSGGPMQNYYHEEADTRIVLACAGTRGKDNPCAYYWHRCCSYTRWRIPWSNSDPTCGQRIYIYSPVSHIISGLNILFILCMTFHSRIHLIKTTIIYWIFFSSSALWLAAISILRHLVIMK